MVWNTSDAKEEAKIYDLRRLDAIMVAIDRIAQRTRAENLKEHTIGPLLAEYYSFLEILWKNILRPKTHERKFDKTFTTLDKSKNMLAALRKLNDELYELKETITEFNTKVKSDYEQNLDFPELKKKHDKGDAKKA
jgi:hypothetical protein